MCYLLFWCCFCNLCITLVDEQFFQQIKNSKLSADFVKPNLTLVHRIDLIRLAPLGCNNMIPNNDLPYTNLIPTT